MNFNPFDLLKNANELQSQIEQAQAQLKETYFTGSSGGGIVKVTVNGLLELIDVQIDPIAVDPRDVKMLQDLIIAASHDAFSKAKEDIKNQASPLLGNLNIPGLNL